MNGILYLINCPLESSSCSLIPTNNQIQTLSNYSILSLMYNTTNVNSYNNGIYGILYKNNNYSQLYFSGPIQLDGGMFPENKTIPLPFLNQTLVTVLFSITGQNVCSYYYNNNYNNNIAKSKNNTSATIIGSVIGSLFGILIVIGIFLIFYKQKLKQKKIKEKLFEIKDNTDYSSIVIDSSLYNKNYRNTQKNYSMANSIFRT
jgi:hypothetical protein